MGLVAARFSRPGLLASWASPGLVAGGGVVGGRVIGSSDALAQHPVERPVTPTDIATTILDRVGIPIADLERFEVRPEGNVIRELF